MKSVGKRATSAVQVREALFRRVEVQAEANDTIARLKVGSDAVLELTSAAEPEWVAGLLRALEERQ